MAVERTLSIIKPDAVAKNVIGKIYSRFESNGLKIVAAKMKHLTRKKPLPAPSAPILLPLSMQMPYTVPTAWPMPPSKWPISSASRKSARVKPAKLQAT